MSENLSKLSGRKGLIDNLFERLGREARETGTPSTESFKELAGEYLVGTANLYGSASFYDFLREENKGKKVYICNGSACMIAGTQHALKDELLKHFAEEEIGEMCCLGRCHENGSFHYKGNNYSARSTQDIRDIVADPKPHPDDHHVGFHGNTVFEQVANSSEALRSVLEKAITNGDHNLLTEITRSGVRGRGGAGFPAGFKLDSCRKEKSDVKFIVCNADEGDPGAFSDRWLLEKRPWSVVGGMILAGMATGATWGALYIRAEYPESIRICKEVIEECYEAGLLGENILGSKYTFDLKVIEARGAYICGEETALLSSIEGQRPEVRVRPPYPTQEGLFSKPTVVNNVETLACYTFVADRGGDAFKALGTERSSGTKLISLDSFFNRPGLYEVEMGTPLRTVIDELGQGFKVPVKAMHIGGPLGGLVPVSKIDDLTIDFESFASNGFLLGHASVVCIPEWYPLVKYIEHLFEFTSHESCGKCFPCRLGSVRGKEMLHKAQHDGYKISRTLMDDLLETLEKGSLCALGGGLPLPVKNALQYFSEELDPYFQK
ncbi:MAG: NAD(P)H-dependent oxidoreductase subunit E [Flavobacteriales bacterium]|nr:NAD(P)H-dependent oxidoreductase subunit E [Flavobacteriales bacterium]